MSGILEAYLLFFFFALWRLSVSENTESFLIALGWLCLCILRVLCTWLRGTVNPLYINTTTNRWEESVPFSSNNILLTLVMLSCKVCAKMLTVVLHIWKKLPIFKWSQMNLCTVGSGIGDCDMPKFFCRQCQVMRTPSLVFSSAWLRWKVSLTLQHLKQMLKRVEVSQPRLDGWKIMLQRRNNIFPCY